MSSSGHFRGTVHSLVSAASTLMLVLLAAVARAEVPVRLSADIPPQSLAKALSAYAQQTHLQVVYLSAIVQDQQSKRATAGLSPNDALKQLLRGTGLRFEFVNARMVRILATTPSQAQQPPDGTGPEEEVVVTGMSVARTVPDTPLSVVVWTGEDLASAEVKSAARLANITPGVEFDSYQDYGAGIETNIAIRGINARDGSTVAVYVDDTPITSDRASIFGRAYPLLFGLDRVEISRGPQGVLMGEGAEGGGVRFVRVQPSLVMFDATVHSEYSTTARGAPSYEFGGEFGGPLATDVLGLRLSAWSRRDGGYVDRVDPFNGVIVDPNANQLHSEAFSGALKLALGEAVSITPAMDYQSLSVHDTSAFYTYLSSPGTGVLSNGNLLAEPYLDRYKLFTLQIAADMGQAQLVATSAFLDRWASARNDATNNASYDFQNPLGPEYPLSYADAVSTDETLQQRVVSQQLRLKGSEDRARLNWELGALYVHAHYLASQDLITAALADGGAINGRAMTDQNTTQLAGFGQADVQLRDGLSATLGLRVERASFQSQTVVAARYDFVDSINLPAEQFSVRGAATLTAPRVALNFQADEHNFYYASLAKGYRMGGPNTVVGGGCEAEGGPDSYGPDSVWSFEIGAKNHLLGGRLQTDSSVFHMQWQNIQTQVPFPFCSVGYISNAGRAASDGFDFGTEAALTDHLNLKLTMAYTHARYTQTVYSEGRVLAGEGDVIGALPLVPAPFSATAIANYDFPLFGGGTARLRAQDVFHSGNHGPFTSDNPDALVYAPARSPDPPTNVVDFSVSASWGRGDVSLFVTNAFDAQPTLQRRNHAVDDTLFYAVTFRPRTMGVAASWRLFP